MIGVELPTALEWQMCRCGHSYAQHSAATFTRPCIVPGDAFWVFADDCTNFRLEKRP